MFIKIVIAIVILIVFGAGGKLLDDQERGRDDRFNAYKIIVATELILAGIFGTIIYIFTYFPNLLH